VQPRNSVSTLDPIRLSISSLPPPTSSSYWWRIPPSVLRQPAPVRARAEHPATRSVCDDGDRALSRRLGPRETGVSGGRWRPGVLGPDQGPRSARAIVVLLRALKDDFSSSRLVPSCEPGMYASAVDLFYQAIFASTS